MSSLTQAELQEIIRDVIRQTLAEHQDKSSLQAIKSQASDKKVTEVPVMDPHKIVAIGTDHGGFEMKEALKTYIQDLHYQVIDCGTNSKDAVDYPDFALAVAGLVSQGKAWRGIVIDGAGIGSCMTANKVPGIRAAMCYDYATAVNSREHNNANVLTLGAGLIGLNLARQIVSTWLTTEFLAGRHTRRVDKIIAIERQFMKSGN